MGEAFLATEAGRPEPVVVKRVLPSLTENPRFLRLFLDETRIASRLIHPNISRIHELGEVKGTWYVAMEYVPGSDLRELQRICRESDLPVPANVALKITADLLTALDYAHRATDSSGRPLRIIHRDVSPHNILVSDEGQVKLIDFGVAKAANRTIVTAPGILKGKFPYMSPEQAHGKRLDARSDLFALGVVLWEMLTASFLFKGKSDADTLKRVRDCKVPRPSDKVEGIPRSVDRVVMKLLSKSPADRYRSAFVALEACHEAMAGMPKGDVKALFHSLVEQSPATEDESGEDDVTVRTEAPEEDPTLSRRGPTRVERAIHRLSLELPSASDESSLPPQRPVRLHNLAPQATPFVGRVPELADLHQLVRGGARVVTLVGPGGSGKTRLAYELAQQLLSHFASSSKKVVPRGGVWFCDLTEARDVESVCAAVARALEWPLLPGDPVAQVGQLLGRRPETLLVLDNAERVVDAAASAIEGWLGAAPALRIVATSREVLGVAGETVFEVPPMRVPEGKDDPRTCEAVMLFLQRARTAQPSVSWDKADAVAVADVVRRLDGLPLAIELAAARMGQESLDALREELPRRAGVLLGGAAQAHDPKATLRGTIELSWRSLSAAERAVLAQVAVFRGGFTLEAVEAVVDLSRVPGAGPVYQQVMALRAKSLVRAYYPRGGAVMRYGLYETIREFAAERLLGTPDELPAYERHAIYYLDWGHTLSRGADSSVLALDALSLERENVLAIFARAQESGRPGPRALKAVLVLDPLLSTRGPFGHHLAMIDAGLALLPKSDVSLRVVGVEARGKALQVRGQVEGAVQAYGTMLDMARSEGSAELEGRAEAFLGTVRRLQERRAEAKRHYERALELHRAVGDRRMEGRTQASLGVLLQELGQEATALESYLRAIEIHREVGDRRFEGITIANLGVQQQAQGLLGPARESYLVALDIHRELGNRRSEGIGHINLGDLYRDLEKGGQALAQYRAALSILDEVGSRRYVGIVGASLAMLYLEKGRLPDARRDFEAALVILDDVKDLRYAGLCLAGLGAVYAGEGRVPQAQQCFDEAAARLRDAGDPAFLDALDVMRGHLEWATGDVQRAQERLMHAERGAPANFDHPGGVPSPSDRSEHVRGSVRSLKAAMKAVRHASGRKLSATSLRSPRGT